MHRLARNQTAVHAITALDAVLNWQLLVYTHCHLPPRSHLPRASLLVGFVHSFLNLRVDRDTGHTARGHTSTSASETRPHSATAMLCTRAAAPRGDG
jgi:hypothetical protein